MPGVVARYAPDLNAHVIHLAYRASVAHRPSPCKVAPLSGNDRKVVAEALKMACELVVARPTGLIESGKSLMDQHDIHVKNPILPSPIANDQMLRCSPQWAARKH